VHDVSLKQKAGDINDATTDNKRITNDKLAEQRKHFYSPQLKIVKKIPTHPKNYQHKQHIQLYHAPCSAVGNASLPIVVFICALNGFCNLIFTY
jgi:hypothetical protein